MAFGDRLRQLRVASGLNQQELADAVGVSRYTIHNYESGKRHPKDVSIARRLAGVLKTTVNELLEEEDYILIDAEQRGGDSARRDMRVLVSRMSAMFAGGELTDEDRDAALRAITDAYWDAKAENKKYTPKKYRV